MRTSVEPKLTIEETKAILETKTAPRVTEASIKDKIATAEYLYHGLLTICILTMRNGFMVQGVSAPASAANYDKDVGDRYAFDNAFKQLWVLEGYLLREKLAFGAL